MTTVTSGYATSTSYTVIPSYNQVASGTTDFAEAIQITFDTAAITYQKLVFIFLRVHDPTTLNRQGGDTGPQYRSAIFYENSDQKETAESEIDKANKEIYDDKIITEVSKLEKFHSAEDYHQDYYRNNQDKPYCQIVINPKLDKFKKEFSKYLKAD